MDNYMIFFSWEILIYGTFPDTITKHKYVLYKTNYSNNTDNLICHTIYSYNLGTVIPKV